MACIRKTIGGANPNIRNPDTDAMSSYENKILGGTSFHRTMSAWQALHTQNSSLHRSTYIQNSEKDTWHCHHHNHMMERYVEKVKSLFMPNRLFVMTKTLLSWTCAKSKDV
eukprot:c14589_g1_i1 orf=128-460(+)